MAAGWRFPKEQYTWTLNALCHDLLAHTPVRIYSNKWEWEAITLQPSWAREFGFHVAAYPDNPDSLTYRPQVPAPWNDWEMWQYSSTGRLPGIAGNVDLNRERVPVSNPPPDTLAADIASHALAIKELL